MSGHTEAPWAVNPVAAQVDAFATGVPVPVCALLWPTEERDEAETEANAKLIAAAPELLEALRIVAAYPIEDFAQEAKPADYPLFDANDWQLQVGHVKAARAAIRKATE